MIGNLDELRYEGGYPTAESIRKLYDQLDLQRAARAYLDFIPGCRPRRARAGLPSCASTARSNPGSTRPGSRARSNW